MLKKYGHELLLILLVGLLVRVALSTLLNNDYFLYLLPWYQYARAHGIDALSVDFTNYTPFYSYLLMIVVRFDTLATPLVLIKLISMVFELGNALLGAALVRVCGGSERHALLATALLWVAPSVLYNGPSWAQADSIWTFFILLSILLFVRGRNGTLPFGVAFAVKAQAAFLGPFVLGMLLRDGKRQALWLLTVPLVYFAVALPVLAAGRTVADVALVYGRQAETFHSLSMHAASLWALLPHLPYKLGVAVGLALAVGAAAGFARVIARNPRRDAEFILLAASASLLLMPFVLPKMHDRYFYAFEVTSIILACVNPRYLVFALIAQVDAVLSYLAFDRNLILGVRIAATGNAAMVFFLLRELALPHAAAIFPRTDWARYGLAVAGVALLLPLTADGLTSPGLKIAYWLLLIANAAAVVLLLRASLHPVAGDDAAPSEPLDLVLVEDHQPG